MPRFDAERRFGVERITAEEPAECIAGEVLQGHTKPHDCPAFGIHCTPERPLGAPMVSAEGACAAYYRYRRSEGISDGDRAIRSTRELRPAGTAVPRHTDLQCATNCRDST